MRSLRIHRVSNVSETRKSSDPVPHIWHLPRRASWHRVGWLLDGCGGIILLRVTGPWSLDRAAKQNHYWYAGAES